MSRTRVLAWIGGTVALPAMSLGAKLLWAEAERVRDTADRANTRVELAIERLAAHEEGEQRINDRMYNEMQTLRQQQLEMLIVLHTNIGELHRAGELRRELAGLRAKEGRR